MTKARPAVKPLSVLLIAALLLLNFSVVALHTAVLSAGDSPQRADDTHPVALSCLLRDLHDSQDPETTACRYAFRQVIRSGGPVPALLSLSGMLPVCPVSCTLSAAAHSSGLAVPRNAERIAAFLHDLAAAL